MCPDAVRGGKDPSLPSRGDEEDDEEDDEVQVNLSVRHILSIHNTLPYNVHAEYKGHEHLRWLLCHIQFPLVMASGRNCKVHVVHLQFHIPVW